MSCSIFRQLDPVPSGIGGIVRGGAAINPHILGNFGNCLIAIPCLDKFPQPNVRSRAGDHLASFVNR